MCACVDGNRITNHFFLSSILPPHKVSGQLYSWLALRDFYHSNHNELCRREVPLS